jgi:RimJ/RimL family protein N-acetyltransferase
MSSARRILIAVPDRFVGDRVIVRPFTDDDAAPLFAAIQESRAHIQTWLPWADQHHSVADTLEFIRRTQARWILRDGFGMGIFSRQEGTFFGGIGLDVVSWDVRAFDIGYWVRKSAEGHGYVSEATRLVTTFAFAPLKARRVTIRCDARNTRSKAIPERLGYVYEGCLRRSELDTIGQPFDMLIFAMIPEDYQKARAAWRQQNLP